MVTSAELCKSVRDGSRWSQACCDAMQAEIKPGDVLLDQMNMTVRYLFCRDRENRLWAMGYMSYKKRGTNVARPTWGWTTG